MVPRLGCPGACGTAFGSQRKGRAIVLDPIFFGDPSRWRRSHLEPAKIAASAGSDSYGGASLRPEVKGAKARATRRGAVEVSATPQPNGPEPNMRPARPDEEQLIAKVQSHRGRSW